MRSRLFTAALFLVTPITSAQCAHPSSDSTCSADSSDASALLQGSVSAQKAIIPRSSDLEENTTKRCAVCFIGQLRDLPKSAPSTHDNFLLEIAKEGVAVDVFVAAEQGGPNTVADFDFHANGSALRFVDHTWRKHLEAEEIEKELYEQNLPAKVIKFYKSTSSEGNWLAPMFGHVGNGLRIYSLESDCLKMMKAEEMKQGKRYDWVIKTRPDFKWLVPHPSLALLTPDRVWSFDGESYGGVNPRHVVGSRDNVFTLLDRRRYIMDGDDVVFAMQRKHGSLQNDEYYLKKIGDWNNMKWGTVQYPGYLIKSPDWVQTGWRRHMLETGGPLVDGNYPNEINAAHETARWWNLSTKPCWKKLTADYLAVDECGERSRLSSLWGPHVSKLWRLWNTRR